MTDASAGPSRLPGLLVSDVEIRHYTINWLTGAGHELLNSDGTMPTAITEVGENLQMRITAPELPLSLSLMIYEGTFASIDPTGEPFRVFDCLDGTSSCPVVRHPDSLSLHVPASDLPDAAVISIFAEYARDPELNSSEGPTNLVGWAFGAHRTE